MKKKVISLILLLVGIAGANHAQSLWELIPLFPIPPIDIPGAIVQPGINPFSADDKLLAFEAEQIENEAVVTALENVGEIQVVIVNAMGVVMHNTIEHVAADDVIRIPVSGWQRGEYMLYIIRDNAAISGEFEIRYCTCPIDHKFQFEDIEMVAM